MKQQRYSLWAITIVLLACVLAVLLFPVAFDSPNIYMGILLASIGIVVFIFMFLIKVHIFEKDKKDSIVDS